MDTSSTPGVGDPLTPDSSLPASEPADAPVAASVGVVDGWTAELDDRAPAPEAAAGGAAVDDLVTLRESPPEAARGAAGEPDWWAGTAEPVDPPVAAPESEAPATQPYPDFTGGSSYELAEPRKRHRFAVREVLETVVLALLIFVAVQGVVQNFRVEGTSMDPSLKNNERLLVNKGVYLRVDLDALSNFLPFIDAGETPKRYLFHGPDRGDVIVFEYPNDPERDFIKRVIGLPGDWVEVRRGVVFINGERIREPYIKNKALYDYGPEQVPPDNYFVLGDNRPNSSDSHVWGFVPADNVIGKAWVTYWPVEEAGMAPNQDLSVFLQ